MKEAFLSYAHEDKVLAGKVKQILETNGVSAFLAHEDLDVSEEWRIEILKHLDTSSALVAIVTDNFAKSVWANQEVGIAIAKGLTLIPLMVGGSTAMKGFLEMHQGIPVSESNLEEAVKSTIPRINKGVSSTERTFYKDLAGVLSRLIVRWQTYKGHVSNVKWTPEAIKEIKDSFRGESERLIHLVSNETEIDLSLNASARTIISQIDLFVFSKIDFTVIYGEQFSYFQELELKGEQVSYSSQALRTWLKQTGKVP